MTPLATARAFAVVMLATSSLAPAAHAAPRYHRCTGGADYDGSPGAFYRRISARRVSCRKARAVVREFAGWTAEDYPRGISPGARFSETFTFAGEPRWTCRARIRTGGGNPYLFAKCSQRGGRRVRFYGVS